MPKKQSNQETQTESLETQTTPNEDIGELLDFNNPSFSFIPSGRHAYRQQGGYLICMACELQHAVFIGMEKLMIGENEDGSPILKNRSELYRG